MAPMAQTAARARREPCCVNRPRPQSGPASQVGAAATAEQFPGEGRLSGLALGSTMATAIFGGATPYVAQLLVHATGSPLVPGAMIAAVAVCVLPVFVRMPETAPR